MEDVSFVDDDIESDDPDYHDEEEYSESDNEHSEDDSDDDKVAESDTDEELEEIRERKRKLKEGMIDLLREGNLTDMNVNNEAYNVTVELGNDRNVDYIERNERSIETRTKRKHDAVLMGEIPMWREFVQHEKEMSDTIFSKYDDNQELGCDRVEKNLEEKDNSDSFDARSLESSNNEEVQNLEMQ